MHLQLELPCVIDEEVVEPGADGVSRGDVAELPTLVEGVGPPPGAVYELVGDDEVPRLVVLPEAAARRRCHDLLDAQLLQGPNVGPVVDPVRGDLVPLPVAGDEGDLPALVCAEGHQVRGGAERGVDLHLPGFLDDLGVVDACPPDDRYLRRVSSNHLRITVLSL